jgi:hypothetical protein
MMMPTRTLATAVLALCAAQVCAAQAAALPAPAAASAAASAAQGGLQRTVIEDDGVRIVETRLRGQAQRITVQSKVAGARPYEILVGRGGRDPSQYRGAAGQSTWSLFDF